MHRGSPYGAATCGFGLQIEVGAASAAYRWGMTKNRPRLVRPRDNRWIAGVCSGLARRFGISAGMMRLLFVLSCLLPGPQILIYLALWILIPNEDRYLVAQ